MTVFTEDFKKKNSKFETETLLVERLIEDIGKTLLDGGKMITDVKYALFDIVVLENVLKRMGVTVQLVGDLRDIRNSIAHIDKRLDVFNFQPANIESSEWAHEEFKDGRFKLSRTFNFQGSIDRASVSTDGSIRTVAPYGMIDNVFLWIDESGIQKFTKISEMQASFVSLTEALRILR